MEHCVHCAGDAVTLRYMPPTALMVLQPVQQASAPLCKWEARCSTACAVQVTLSPCATSPNSLYTAFSDQNAHRCGSGRLDGALHALCR